MLVISTTIWNHPGGVSVREHVGEEDGLQAFVGTVWLHRMTWGDPGLCGGYHPLDVGPGWLRIKMNWTVSGHPFIPSLHLTVDAMWLVTWSLCHPDLPGTKDCFLDLWAKLSTLSPQSFLVGVFLPQKWNRGSEERTEGTTNWSRQKTFFFSRKQIPIHSQELWI